MNAASQFPNEGYYIASGFTNTMYTLRQRFIKVTDIDEYEASRYICKLAADKDKAEAKAKEVTGFDITVGFELNEWGTGGTTTYKGDGSLNLELGGGDGTNTEQIIIKKPEEVIKTTIMNFGKYEGKTIAEIATFDKQYLVWLYYNSYGNKFKCVEEAIAIAIQDVIEQRQAEAKKAEQERNDKIAKALELESTPQLVGKIGEAVKGVFKYTGYTQDSLYHFVNEEGQTFVLVGYVGQNYYGRVYNIDNLGIKRLKVGTSYEIVGAVSNTAIINGDWLDLGSDSRYIKLTVSQVAAKSLKAVK